MGRWYGIVVFNVPLDTLWVISETTGEERSTTKTVDRAVVSSL